MFKFDIIYDPIQKDTLHNKYDIAIKCGFIEFNKNNHTLGEYKCLYKNKYWTHKLSIDNKIFNNNVHTLWIQFYDYITKNQLTDLINISENIINRQIQPFENKIELTSQAYLIRISEPYCDLYNIFPQQYQTSLEILNKIKQGFKHIVMISEMQQGKTGCAKSVAYNLLNSFGYQKNKLFFICGMNDNNLLDQAKVEFQGLIPHENILFSKRLQKIITNASFSSLDFHHTVIFIDESHYASQQDSLIYKFLKNIVGVTADGYTNTWQNNEVIIISISATPMAEIANLDQPESDKQSVILHTGHNYYGVNDMIAAGLVKQAYNLNKQEEVDKFIQMIQLEYTVQINNNQYKYSIIRLGSLTLKDQLEIQIRKKIQNIQFINYYSGLSDSTLIDFNLIVQQIPIYPTIIWIYDSLRAGKQLDTTNIHLVHDSHCCAPDVAAQGLAGRLCGYGKKNHNVICYTNVKALNKFIDWINHQYNPLRIPAGSKDIINGFDANNINHWQANIPILFKMTPDLITYCLRYRLEHGKTRYDNDFKKYCKDQILTTNQHNPLLTNILSNYYPSKNGGFMIIDHLNKQNSVNKHWESNYNASINNNSSLGFATPNTKPAHPNLYYIFLNLLPKHQSFGFGLLCYKEYIDDLSSKSSKASTKATNITNPHSWGHMDYKIPQKPKIPIKKKIFLKSTPLPKLKFIIKLKST